jgi:hypothetical protein
VSKWSEVNSGADKFCDMPVCDFDAVGYVITPDGARFCLCETCRQAFYLGIKACRAGGDLEFRDLYEEEEEGEDE